MIYTMAPFSVPVFVLDVNWSKKEILEKFNLRDNISTAFLQRKNLEKNTEFDSLKSIIIKAMKEANTALGYEVPAVEVVSMWFNGYQPLENIHPHTHPNSWFSGVYYPYGCEVSPIKFFNPLPQLALRPKAVRQTAFNNDSLELNLKDESIIIFPSWLMHCTTQATDKKISVAFNLWPRGLIEIDDISKVIA